MIPVEFFLSLNSETAINFQVRSGMPASDFLRELYEVQMGEKLNCDHETLQRFNQQAIDLAKQQNVECGYDLENIRAQLFSAIVTAKPGKEISIEGMVRNNPLFRDSCRVCPSLQVITNYILKLLKQN